MSKLRSVTFTVLGTPIAKGSMKSWGRGKMVNDSKRTKPWQDTIGWAAKAAWKGKPSTAAIRIWMRFRLARPKDHYGTGKNSGILKKSAPKRPAVKPDYEKLERCVSDALSRIVYVDDAQIVIGVGAKIYADYLPPGVRITVEELD